MKVKRRIFLITLSIILIGIMNKVGLPQDIRASHIEGNVPDEKEFDSILRRDLAKYFSDSEDSKIEISYELFRKEPTQTGIAYPKFYLWVKVTKDERLIEEGAVRVAAIEKREFEVTDYLNKARIAENPGTVYKVFPRALCDQILKRARER